MCAELITKPNSIPDVTVAGALSSLSCLSPPLSPIASFILRRTYAGGVLFVVNLEAIGCPCQRGTVGLKRQVTQPRLISGFFPTSRVILADPQVNARHLLGVLVVLVTIRVTRPKARR